MTSPADGAPARREKIVKLIHEFHQRLTTGEPLSEEGLIAEHPELMPELAKELSLYRATAAGETIPGKRSNPTSPPPAAPGVHDMQTQTAGAFKPGFVIPGYRLVRELSRGGQGIVFQGIQESTQRKVAIKVLRHGPLSSEEEETRIQREAQVLAALRHPHIVYVFDCGRTDDGSFYLVMEFVSGQPLDKWMSLYAERQLNGHGCDDPAEALKLFMKISDAINAAHLRGVVHRDLKPSNIFVDTLGEPRILDFGLAHLEPDTALENRATRPVTITGQFLGSLPWASPEQAEGIPSKIDCRTDVYSLGVILYQMLTGQFPYEVVGNMRDVLDNIMRAEPSPPSVVIQASEAKRDQKQRRRRRTSAIINPAIDAIVLKALAKRPEDRYANAGELSRDIANYLSGKPTSAIGGSGQSTSPWPARALIALGFVLVAAGTAALMHYLMPPRERIITEIKAPEPMVETPITPAIDNAPDPAPVAPKPDPIPPEPVVVETPPAEAPKKLLPPPSGWKLQLSQELVDKGGVPVAGMFWQPDGNTLTLLSERDGKWSQLKIPTSFASDPAVSRLVEAPTGARQANSLALAWLSGQKVALAYLGSVQYLDVSFQKEATPRGFAFGPGGSLLATASSDNWLRIWMLPGRSVRDFLSLGQTPEAVAALDWSAPKNKILVALNNEPKIMIFGEHAAEEGSIDSKWSQPLELTCGPTGSSVAVSYADRVAVFDFAEKKLAFEIPLGSRPLGVRWSGDEQYLAIMSETPDQHATVQVFAAANPDKASASFPVSANHIAGCCPFGFVPNTSTLAVATGNGLIALISAEQNQAVGKIYCLDNGVACLDEVGNYRASRGIEPKLRCVWTDDVGEHALPPDEFANQFDFKNDASFVRRLFKK